MGWKAYRLVYQAKSPIHIGWHTLGYIKLTRYYITGKAMWGAMTANLVRACYGYEDYIDVGNLLCSNILTSYFYPSLDPDMSPMIPEYTDTGLRYGDCNKQDFERLFIKSYGQTAVVPESNTAEDETLHESEFIASVIEDEASGLQLPVYFVGYLFLNDEAEYNGCQVSWLNIENAISELFVGGDRKYGWGRLQLINKSETADMFGLNIDNLPNIKIPTAAPIPAHIAISASTNLKGDIEPLVGREWDNNGAGQRIKIAGSGVYWMPGSVFTTKGMDLTIGKYGLLELCEES